MRCRGQGVLCRTPQRARATPPAGAPTRPSELLPPDHYRRGPPNARDVGFRGGWRTPALLPPIATSRRVCDLARAQRRLEGGPRRSQAISNEGTSLGDLVGSVPAACAANSTAPHRTQPVSNGTSTATTLRKLSQDSITALHQNVTGVTVWCSGFINALATRIPTSRRPPQRSRS